MANNDIKLADSMAERVEQLAEQRHIIELGGGESRLQKQRERGKQTARERIDNLLDAYSFDEVGAFRKHRTTLFGMDKAVIPADGVVTGRGTIFGRPVHVASQDFTVMGGSAGETQSTKVVETMEQALLTGTPFLFFYDSGGARIQEGIDSLSGYGKMFFANVKLSGVVPQIAIIAGPCAGGASYSPALTDFIIMTKKAHMFITGPAVIKAVTGEDVTADQLGGADAHMTTSGNIHFVAEDDDAAVLIAKKLLSFLPQNNTEEAAFVNPNNDVSPCEELRDIVPVEGTKGYDVRDVISRIVDWGDYLEVKAGWATNIVTAFARFNGRTVGVVANQPKVMSGCLDIDASDKATEFINFCDSFNIPLVQLVDVPGFLPGVQQEYGGIIRHGAKMLYAYSEATVPKVTVVLRKAYGGSYLAMCNRDLGADAVYAWPTAEIAVMGADGAANVIFRREIDAAEDPAATRAEKIEEYRNAFNTPYVAAARGQVDDVIDPADTRRKITAALEMYATKRQTRPAKKHGNMPC
ncbi:acyl-CoA carboxylase subunit beta [Propionibacterium australiense]|jgi:methylmalonyl-CoA carboxyltransferase large subunit|uniref:Acyl-CoA carboxylase subunit beta n=1 Tax=Propionibacterium australiense TaxID=119981 RepID=A0A383S572_9ACTN|nr:carboxyl transferase domain-containing protein [Propionibacterium australiense]RLP10070.1 acyl-CoA carboxylase subunit beta [Propionibacterium australiense]RLP11354.1 acyl-CoA carboxylase subunit beta [Propionibacterium australiense]SYZ32993.1 methylmalonyl-CoA carboxytransferase [Propionibacterium australiense]VEH92283.1 Methylmalonyl-CoA carboxyltransferase 12S subunit [Propionibacterium australiense]